MRAAAEVRAAYRELTHDATTMASLDDIAALPELELAATATLHSLESGSELAYVVAEKAEAPSLTGPARALSIRAHNDIEARLATQARDRDVVWVSPRDILARRIVPAPRPVVDGLRQASLRTVDACDSAASASAAYCTTPKASLVRHDAGVLERRAEEWRPRVHVLAERHRGR
jgi:hypothetical protein